MKPSLRRIWGYIKWPLIVLFLAYCVLVVWRAFVLVDEENTVATVAEIHQQRLTLADVEGNALPPVPDQAENDATLEGIDKNNNGIRDDVEHAIFKKYPTDKKARAAALQYAKELQMEFTYVKNSETLVAVIQEQSRGFGCLYLLNKRAVEEIENLVFSTSERANYSEELREKYMTSYGLPNGEDCDITF